MNISYYKEWSNYLGREMEFKVYGEPGGRPVMIFPCQSGRFYDWEDRHMHDLAASWIESGKMQMFCIDSIDRESWDQPGGPERQRIEMHERWFNYVCEEFYPRMMELNGGQHWGKVICGGTSMGAAHAVNFFLRRPDLFNGTVALSGVYKSDMFFGSYMDDLVYRNSPVDYMSNIDPNHPHVAMINNADRFIMCVGQGAWEDELLASTRQLAGILQSKGIKATVDIWGTDVNHDWPWWEKQWPYFLGQLLG